MRKKWRLACCLIGFAMVVKSNYVFAVVCGDVLTRIDGVEVKSNGANNGTGNYCAGLGPFGYQYQCAELIDRYFGYNWTNTNGRDYFLKATQMGFAPFANSQSTTIPQHGDMLGFNYIDNIGHIALIDSVLISSDGTYTVNFAEQNVNNTGRGSLKMTKSSDGKYTIANRGNYTVQGWVRSPDILSVPLIHANWTYRIGHSFMRSQILGATITYQNQEVSLSQAIDNGWIYSTVYGYNDYSGWYTLDAKTAVFDAGKPYFFYSYVFGAKINFMAN